MLTVVGARDCVAGGGFAESAVVPPFRRMWNVAPAFNVSVVIPISFATASRVRRRSAARGCCDPARCVLRPAGTPGGGCRSASLAGSSVCSTLTLTCRSRVGDSCSCTCPWTLTAPCGTCSSGGSPAADSVTVLRSPSKRPYLVDRVDVVIAEHEPIRSRRPAPPVLVVRQRLAVDGDVAEADDGFALGYLVVRHVIIFGHGHGLQRAIIDESQHRTPERLIMAQH